MFLRFNFQRVVNNSFTSFFLNVGSLSQHLILKIVGEQILLHDHNYTRIRLRVNLVFYRIAELSRKC